ncbi:MAG: class I SAM-dependent methyltransferase, partial [Planctomycetota bacterium]
CLEIGCGEGYGSRYLADLGVKSYSAVDKDSRVIESLSGKHKDIKFETVDLDLAQLPFKNQSIDFCFSSNVFEHIAYIDPVLNQCNALLRDEGVAVIAVPPVVTSGMLYENAKNIFHINNIPPWAWVEKLNRYFKTVEYYRHWVVPSLFNHDGTINKKVACLKDFIFELDPNYVPSTITSVFVCSSPLKSPILYNGGEGCPPEWNAAKLSAEARQSEFVKINKNLEEISNYWRNEIESLYSWIELNCGALSDKARTLDSAMRHLRMLIGKD